MNQDRLIAAAKNILADRRSMLYTLDVENREPYYEGVSDGLAYLISEMFPKMGGATDVKALIDD